MAKAPKSRKSPAKSPSDVTDFALHSLQDALEKNKNPTDKDVARAKSVLADTADDLHEEQEYVEDMLNHARGEGDLWEILWCLTRLMRAWGRNSSPGISSRRRRRGRACEPG